MAKFLKVYDVFISSPSDVTSERDIVQEAIEQLNQIRGAKEGFRLNPLRWENNVSSQIGAHPQKIINEQIGNEYDIFIGILCTRFGQTTGDYQSGTEEEFFRAYDRFKSNKKNPEILFYFKDPRMSELPIDANQLLKVSNFKEKIGSLGIYEEFKSPDSLKQKILSALVKVLDRLESSSSEIGVDKDTKNENSVISADNPIVKISEFDQDVGIIDLADMVQDAIEAFSSNMNVTTEATEDLSGKIESKTEELRSLNITGNSRDVRKKVKKVIEDIALEVQKYCHIIDQSTPNAKREFSSALSCMEHAVIISNQDGFRDKSEVYELVKELLALKVIITKVYEKTDGFRNSILGLPRMTSNLNQAKRRAVNSIGDILKFLSDASMSIDVTLESISS